MKLTYKICLVNVGIAFLLTLIFILGIDGSFREFFPFFGIISLVGGAIDLLASLILFLVGKKMWAQGYLLTAGVLILLGSVVCTPMFYR